MDRRTLPLVLALFLMTGCPWPRPEPACHADPDAGTVLQTPCAGKADGSPCCFGTSSGACAGNRCVAGAVPMP